MNVEHKEYASKGVAGTGLGFGIAGTALALLQNGGLGGILGGGWGGWGNCGCGNAAAFAGRDAEIARLSSELDSYRNLIAVWDNLNTKREATDKKVATLEARCETMQYVLGNITKVVVPNTSVCPGWGAVTIAPETPAAGA
jgi:hypothetical protein